MSDTEISARFDDGGWNDRVKFADQDGFAYRPGEVLVPIDRAPTRRSHCSRAEKASFWKARRARKAPLSAGTQSRSAATTDSHLSCAYAWIDELRAAGIPAHPNYVLFSHCRCCCGGNQTWAFAGNPFAANPFAANPFAANPFAANPFAANPFAANTYQPNPLVFQAGEALSPEITRFRTSGRRSHSARPAEPPDLPVPPAVAVGAPTIVVIDTGLANAHNPGALQDVDPEDVYPPPPQGESVLQPFANEVWDRDGDNVIDSMAGHGTFIAGIIKMIAPTCRLRVQGPLTGYGDISERDLTIVLQRLLERGAPDLLNLSLGGYAVEDMPALGKAVRDLRTAGTIVVASAGNDGTCQPTFPAAFRGVIAVGALGPFGPAHFTNYGHWVRACAPGVDVVSTFFEADPNAEAERFNGWATWSGTSFAAPAVVGAPRACGVGGWRRPERRRAEAERQGAGRQAPDRRPRAVPHPRAWHRGQPDAVVAPTRPALAERLDECVGDIGANAVDPPRRRVRPRDRRRWWSTC